LARTSNQRSLNAAADALQALRDATQETVHLAVRRRC
jgi:DNA-binding IclR family transcriptional regulator